MDTRERIAFAMFKTDYPSQRRKDIQIDQLGAIEADVGKGVTVRADLTIDWNANRQDYLRKADAALREFDCIVAERISR